MFVMISSPGWRNGSAGVRASIGDTSVGGSSPSPGYFPAVRGGEPPFLVAEGLGGPPQRRG